MSNGSFSFCGVDVKWLGLEYAPDISEVFVYRPAAAESHVESFPAHDGGYYYGSWREPKDFSLRCIFQGKDIDRGIMAKVYSLFKVGKSGKLVFSRRPWCYYYATVTEQPQTDFRNYLNGVITVTLKAMYPYARSDIMTTERTDWDNEILLANTAVFESEDMELPIEFDLTQETTFNLVNPGSERAALGFYISGDVGDGVIIKNTTTGQECKIVKLTKENSTNVNKELLVDPISGKVSLVGENSSELAFMYHSYGFLELEPSFPALREIYTDSEPGENVHITNILKADAAGKYVFLNSAWHKVIDQPDPNTLTVYPPINWWSNERTMIIPMNELEIKPVTTMDIHIKFVFKPTYA